MVMVAEARNRSVFDPLICSCRKTSLFHVFHLIRKGLLKDRSKNPKIRWKSLPKSWFHHVLVMSVSVICGETILNGLMKFVGMFLWTQLLLILYLAKYSVGIEIW